MATDTSRGEVVLFGARTVAGVPTAQTWTWDGVDWTLRAPATQPRVRGGAAMAFDSLRGRVVLFGGQSGNRYLSETWEWDGVTWILCATATAPAGRSGHRLAFDAARGRTLLFGGRGSSGNLADTWEWDGVTWVQRTPIVSPPARAYHGLAYDPLLQRVVLCGGLVMNDTWEWDGTNWLSMASLPAPAASVLAAQLVFDPSRGRVVMQNSNPETWEWNGSQWLHAETLRAPSSRFGAAMTYERTSSQVLLFGGGAISYVADTWSWDGDRWQLRASTGPSARAWAAMAHDPVRARTVLFGGISGSTSLADTWEWNGTAWAAIATGTGPSVRSGAAMAFDPASGTTMLFGGGTSYLMNLYADTWRWNGATWTQLSPAMAPPPRAYAAMAFDVARNEMVLFGGATSYTANSGETWVFANGSWQQRLPATSPVARRSHQVAYDSVRQRIVMVGGYPDTSSSVILGDAWQWDGVTWTAISTATPLPPRLAHGLAYDEARQEVIVFGGQYSAILNDTWSLAAAGGTAGFGAGCSGTLGVPQFAPLATSQPRLGGTVLLEATALPSSIGIVAMGFSDSATTLGIALPLPLAFAGMPGCSLLVDPLALGALVGASNRATWSLPVPYLASMLGLTFFNQAFAYDPPANSAGLTASNGVRTRIGN